MTMVLLWLLATIDAAFTGYRAAAGRDLRIDKRAYYRRAGARGAIAGQLAAALVGAFVLLTLFASARPAALVADHVAAASRMSAIYLVYGAAIACAFAVWLVPSLDA